MLLFGCKELIPMFFTVDEKKQINERAKHIPQMYVKEVTQIIEDVINHKPIYIEKKHYEPITKEDFD
jgi:methionine aminopeptidase